jgi:hypothetical protein
MAELVEIRDNKGGTGDAPASAVAQAPRVAVEAAIEGSIALTGVLRQLAAAEQQLLSAAGPAAAWLGCRLSGTQVANSLPVPVSQQTGTVIISVAVAAVLMKAALHVKALIDAPLAEYCTTDGCIPGMGQFVCFLYSVSHIIDMPDSLREVVGCVVLLTLVQQLGAFVLRQLPLQVRNRACICSTLGSSPSHIYFLETNISSLRCGGRVWLHPSQGVAVLRRHPSARARRASVQRSARWLKRRLRLWPRLLLSRKRQRQPQLR